MNEKYLIVKEDFQNEYSQKISFLAAKNINASWKEAYRKKCIFSKQPFIEQGGLSDFDYYVKINMQNRQNEEIKNIHQGIYYLLVDGIPVTRATIMPKGEGNLDISYVTASSYTGKGYATKMVDILTNKFFEDETIFSAIIVPFVPESIPIAERNGYHLTAENWYQKENPNYKKSNDRTI